MEKIYIEPNTFKCYKTNLDGIFREVTLSEDAKAFFADKCTTFIEGYRLKPDGETWVREDGKIFSGGEMITPWKDYAELDNAQREYERQLLKEYEAELAEMDAALLEVQYQSLTEGL